MADNLNDVASKYSAIYPVINDADLRVRRGLKIAGILAEVLGDRHVDMLLDVGCSNGKVLDTVAAKLQPKFAIGIDMDAAVAPKPEAARVVMVANAMSMPIANESIDVIICNHTYEHVPDSTVMFAEIYRVLKESGVVYFSAMNARWPMEPHYHLPFVHWLPASLSSFMLKKFGRAFPYLETPLTTPNLKRLVSAFNREDYTLKVIANPEKYFAQDIVKASALSRFYQFFARVFYGFLPGYIWILTKRKRAASV